MNTARNAKRENLTIRVSPEIRDRLAAVAASQDRTIAYIANICFTEHLPTLETPGRMTGKPPRRA